MSLDYEPKKVICSNCGDEFYLESYKDSRTTMCSECYKDYRTKYWRDKKREYRSKENE